MKWENIYGETPRVFHNKVADALNSAGQEQPRKKLNVMPALMPVAAAVAICAVIGVIVTHNANDGGAVLSDGDLTDITEVIAEETDVTEPGNPIFAKCTIIDTSEDFAAGNVEMELRSVHCDGKCLDVFMSLYLDGEPVSVTAGLSYILTNGERQEPFGSVVSSTDLFTDKDGKAVICLTIEFNDEVFTQQGRAALCLTGFKKLDANNNYAYGDDVNGDIIVEFDIPEPLARKTAEVGKNCEAVIISKAGGSRESFTIDTVVGESDESVIINTEVGESDETVTKEPVTSPVTIYSAELSPLVLRVEASEWVDLGMSDVVIKFKDGSEFIPEWDRATKVWNSSIFTFNDVSELHFKTPIDAENVESVTIGDLEIAF